ncbi:hypothetical protein P421_06900 [Heyndrickxia coagulans P38]|nr:hypothetical protein P421_06900 [Heyndrickxia coagulans P38]
MLLSTKPGKIWHVFFCEHGLTKFKVSVIITHKLINLAGEQRDPLHSQQICGRRGFFCSFFDERDRIIAGSAFNSFEMEEGL